MKSFSEFQEEINKKVPPVTGLGGGGGGTDSITDKSPAKSLGKRIKDVGKILTFPLHKRRKDPTEKFASEEVAIANSMGGGGGGTDSITAKSSAKSFKKRVGDVAKVLTFPFHKKRVDPTEKFATQVYKTQLNN